MAVVYEDTPFAEYLADIGSEEVLVKQPNPFEQEGQAAQADGNTMVSWFSQFTLYIIENFQEVLSTALPLQEENAFEERFKYLLCTSHLLNDTLSVYFYDSNKPNPIEIRDAGLYFGGISRRNFETLLSSLIGMIIVGLTWLLHDTDSRDIGSKIMQLPIAFALILCGIFFLYRRMRRKAMKTLHNSALYFLEVLVYNCQTLDINLNKALTMIQEIELVSRGYRLSIPLLPASRIEQSSKNRRCGMLRQTVYDILKEAFIYYHEVEVTMHPEVSKENLAIMYNMYNIIPCPTEEWNFEEEKDILSLEHLKQCFHKMHTKRREILCHFLALDVMTPGRDSGRRDYEHHWTTVDDHLDSIGAINGHYCDQIIAISTSELYTVPTSKQDFMSQPTPTITNKKLKVYLNRLASIEQHIRSVQAKMYICNEDTRKYCDRNGVVAESERERLINQYESVSKDFTYMFQEWEDGKKALNEIMRSMQKSSDLGAIHHSLDKDIETLNDENSHDENSSEKTLSVDWSQTDEPLDLLERIFEAEAEVEYVTKVKSVSANSEHMDQEIKDVLARQKPRFLENEIAQPIPEDLKRIQMHVTRIAVATN